MIKNLDDENYYVTPLYDVKVEEGKMTALVSRRCNMRVTEEEHEFPLEPERFVDLASNNVMFSRNNRCLDDKDFADPEYRQAVDRSYDNLVDLVGESNVKRPTYNQINFKEC